MNIIIINNMNSSNNVYINNIDMNIHSSNRMENWGFHLEMPQELLWIYIKITIHTKSNKWTVYWKIY
jgi:hypothetical protein